MLTNFPNADKYDLTLNSVYKDYPRQYFPAKLNKTFGTKTKELKFEHIDDDLYDQQANMATFRVLVKSRNLCFYGYGHIFLQIKIAWVAPFYRTL
jgi:hypothetical protein